MTAEGRSSGAATGKATHQEYRALYDCLALHYNCIRRQIQGLIGAQALDWETVDDIVHDVIVESLQRAKGFRYDGDPRFARWISTITQRVVANAILRHRREPPTLSIQNSAPTDGIIRPSRVPGAIPTPSTVASLKERCRGAMVAYASLSEPDRTVIRLAQFEGRRFADVSEKLGCSVKAAAKRYVRAMLRLRRETEPQENGIHS